MGHTQQKTTQTNTNTDTQHKTNNRKTIKQNNCLYHTTQQTYISTNNIYIYICTTISQ